MGVTGNLAGRGAGGGVVIDRLRSLWNRPIQEHERVYAFAIAVVIVLVVAGVLYVTRPDEPGLSASTSTATVVARPAPAAEPTPTVTQAPAGTPEANAPFAAPPAAARAMRTFLDGYLDYLYGHGDAGSIERAAPQLVRRLAAHPPRVSPAQLERHPKVVEVRARRPRAGRVQLVATIDAGETSQYPIGALLRIRNGRWQVTEILNDE